MIKTMVFRALLSVKMLQLGQSCSTPVRTWTRDPF